ncbi:unnamed protein product, partial [Brenthis ino]
MNSAACISGYCVLDHSKLNGGMNKKNDVDGLPSDRGNKRYTNAICALQFDSPILLGGEIDIRKWLRSSKSRACYSYKLPNFSHSHTLMVEYSRMQVQTSPIGPCLRRASLELLRPCSGTCNIYALIADAKGSRGRKASNRRLKNDPIWQA